MSIRTFSFLGFVSAFLFVFSTAGFCADHGSSEMALRGLQANEMTPVGIALHPPVIVPATVPTIISVAKRAVPAPVAARPADIGRPVQVIELSKKVTLESLRRSADRYSEIGAVSRFLELSTELPPLFGEEQD